MLPLYVLICNVTSFYMLPLYVLICNVTSLLSCNVIFLIKL